MKIKITLLAILTVGCIFLANPIFAGDSTTNDISRLTTDALTAYKTGNYDVAVNDFTRLIQLHETDAYLGRGMAYGKKMQYEQGIADLTEAIWRRPSEIAFKSRGNIYARQNDHVNAAADYSEAIKLNPTNADLYELRAIEFLCQKNFDAAYIDCNTALLFLADIAETNQMVVDVYLNRALALREKNEKERSLADFNKVLQLEPQNGIALTCRGVLFMRSGKYDNALKDFKDSIRFKPDEGQAYNNIALIQCACPDEKYRDGHEAITNAKEACRLCQWKDPVCIETLAASYAEIGSFVQAVRWEQRAIESGLKGKELKESKDRLELYEQKKPFRINNE